MRSGPARVVLLLLISAAISGLIPPSKAFSRAGTLYFNHGEGDTTSAVIDQAGGFAYFGTYTSPGIIVKIRLSDFTRVSNLTLNPGESYLRTSSVIDPAHGYAYFATDTSPGIIVKIRLSDFSRVGALTMSGNHFETAVIDSAKGYAYFGTYTNPGTIVKVRLSDFTVNSTLTLNSGEDTLYSSVIDPSGGYAYFGTDTSTGIIVKVRLSDFTRNSSLTLNSSEGLLRSAVFDSANGYAYFGTFTNPSVVVKVRLSNFTLAGSLTLNPDHIQIRTAVIDPAGGFVYWATHMTIPGFDYVVKISLSQFSEVSSLSYSSSVGQFVPSVIDPAAGYAYFGAAIDSTTSAVQKIQVASPPSAPTLLKASSSSIQVSLSWNAPSFNGDRNLTGYRIYRGTTAGSESPLFTIGNVTSYGDTSATPGQVYFYKVTAVNNFGESIFSNEASTSKLSSSTLPPVPLILTVITAACLLLFKHRSIDKRKIDAS